MEEYKYYDKKCPKCGEKIDPYTIFRMYGIKDHAIEHAMKKLLRLGTGHKEELQDVIEARDSLNNYIEYLESK